MLFEIQMEEGALSISCITERINVRPPPPDFHEGSETGLCPFKTVGIYSKWLYRRLLSYGRLI